MARSPKYVLALDQGTTGSTAILFDKRGRPVSRGYREITQHYPQPGWVEHDAAEIWVRTKAAAKAAMRAAKASPREVAAIGITNQRETLVAWNARTGKPLTRAIVWQDRRTADALSALKRDVEPRWVTRRTGLRLDPYFSGSKLRWMLKNVASVARARKSGLLRWGTMDSWLVWNLSKGAAHVTDASNASRTLLFDYRRLAYTDELLALWDAREEELPAIVDNAGPLATATREFLGSEVPITGLAGDQQAALYGQACLRPGMAKNTYGTGCFALANVGGTVPQPKAGLLGTVAWRIGKRTRYALEGSVFVAGSAVQWLRDGLGLLKTAAESESWATRVPDSGGLVLVPAFAGLGAPHWDPYARGLMIGITRGTTKAHVVRACLESIALQSEDVFGLFEKSGGRRLSRIRVDGGAVDNAFLMQYQADVSGRIIERAAVADTTALGAAFLAGVGCGFFADEADVERAWSARRVFKPQKSAAWRRGQREQWDAAVARSLKWAR